MVCRRVRAPCRARQDPIAAVLLLLLLRDVSLPRRARREVLRGCRGRVLADVHVRLPGHGQGGADAAEVKGL